MKYRDTVALKLRSIEDRFLDYLHSPFDVSKLEFKDQISEANLEVTPSELDISKVLDMLRAISSATKQLEYQARGFESLLVDLKLMERPAPPHETKYDDLTATILIELEKLLFSIYLERRARSGPQLEELGDLRPIHRKCGPNEFSYFLTRFP